MAPFVLMVLAWKGGSQAMTAVIGTYRSTVVILVTDLPWEGDAWSTASGSLDRTAGES